MYYKNITYRHSFIISKESIDLKSLSDYLEYKLYEFKVYYSSSYNITVIEKGNTKHLLLGYSLDIRDHSKSDEDILEMLHNSESIVEDLEFIAGRYIYIKALPGEMNIYTDASQLLPLVFSKEAEILSSHDNLLAQVLSDNNLTVTRRPFEVHNELDFTRYEEIQKFNPSMMLSTKNFSYDRIYPRAQIRTESVKKVSHWLKPYLDEMINWLKNNKQKKFVSITAGIDSRVSAALTREIEGIEYLTYYMPDNYIKKPLAKSIYKTDRLITEQMKSNLRWNHSIVNLTEIPISKEELNYYKNHFNSKHGYRLDKYYREYKNYFKALHIKSTVFGMGKADFPTNLDVKSDDLEFYTRSIHGISKEFKSHYDYDKEVLAYFERNLVKPEITKGRHYYDLYHLESRMGNWHSSLTLETDPETEEFIFTNSRKIIDLIQMPSITKRRSYSLYKDIVNEYWPLLLFFGINQTENVNKVQNKLITFKNNGITVSGTSDLEIQNNKEEITIMPKDVPIDYSRNYYCMVENNTKDKHKVVISGRYDKESARGSIRVILRYNNKIEEYDILDLLKGIEIKNIQKKLHINILFNKVYSNESWRKAAKLFLYFNK